MRDSKGTGAADQRFTFVSGLNKPQGMALKDGYFYFSDLMAVWRVPYKPGQTKAGKPENYLEDRSWAVHQDQFVKLFLVHGEMDDNVPPYNTQLVVDALVKAGKDFDLLMLPHARHGYAADANYVMRRRWDYFIKNLLGGEPPKEYQIGKPVVSP